MEKEGLDTLDDYIFRDSMFLKHIDKVYGCILQDVSKSGCILSKSSDSFCLFVSKSILPPKRMDAVPDHVALDELRKSAVRSAWKKPGTLVAGLGFLSLVAQEIK